MELSIEKAKRIVNNIGKVVREKNIEHLNKAAYEFIILKLGAIAHFNLHGYGEVYRDLRKFVLRLQTSEYSNDRDYNLRQADRQEKDPDFRKSYGEFNQKNTAWAMREIVRIAREYENEIATYFGEQQEQAELEHAEALAGKYGYRLARVPQNGGKDPTSDDTRTG